MIKRIALQLIDDLVTAVGLFIVCIVIGSGLTTGLVLALSFFNLVTT